MTTLEFDNFQNNAQSQGNTERSSGLLAFRPTQWPRQRQQVQLRQAQRQRQLAVD